MSRVSTNKTSAASTGPSAAAGGAQAAAKRGGAAATAAAGKAARSLREVYDEACASHRVRPNSEFQKMLPTRAGQQLPSEVLDLSRNYVGDRGLLAVLDVVQRCSSLQRLVLIENGLRNNAIKALVSVAVKHPTLRSIDVSDNYISEGAGKALEVLLKENPRITELTFSNTKIDVDCRLRLKDLVALNAAHKRS